MFECAEVSADGVVRSLGCFADDGTPVSREELVAALDDLPSTDEFIAAACPPGSPERAALPDRWIVRLLQLGERRAAALAADRAELVGLLAAQRPAEPGPAVPEVMDVSEWLPCELALVHPYGERRAGRLIRTSLALTTRFLATLEALRRGEIDEAHADAVVDLLEPLDADLAARVETDVLPRAGGRTPGGLRDALRRRIDRLDPEARERRHQRARSAADVRWWATEDGMGRLMADLPLPEAAACGTAIDGWARQLRAAGDARPIGQLRTAVLRDLVLRPWERRPAVGVSLVVHAQLSTLRGGDGPAEVDGHPVSGAQCRALLAEAGALGLRRPEGGSLEFAVHDGAGDLVAVGTRRAVERGAREAGLRRPPGTPHYRPRTGQRRFTAIRDRRCRHPQCTRRVGRTDLDHCVPWPRGATTCDNLCCLCRRHHRLKTHARGWRFRMLPGGRLEVTTPSGVTRVTDPPRVVDAPPVRAGAPPSAAGGTHPPPF
ncbi:HNH endonuclease signature motif containing protein [Geodermatophilus normandii]|uniref:HNH endonuclease signature motif containing protein n=1 Tax=Geodermatophilus normandii TaxID=1137989 RepID=UPI000D70C0D1|nr:HNH endonuclease signature motif containing protein [Geodermatophilus normandii]